MVIEIISPSLLRPALYNKKVLIWLYLVKITVILGKKDVSMNVKSQVVNGGLCLLRLISWIVLCC